MVTPVRILLPTILALLNYASLTYAAAKSPAEAVSQRPVEWTQVFSEEQPDPKKLNQALEIAIEHERLVSRTRGRLSYEYVDTCYVLSVTYDALGKSAKAEHWLEKAVELQRSLAPLDAEYLSDLLVTLGDLYIGHGKEGGVKYYEQAWTREYGYKRFSRSAEYSSMAISRRHMDSGNYERGISFALQAVRLSPPRSVARSDSLNQLGALYQSSGQSTRAKEMFRLAVGVLKDLPHERVSLLVALNNLGATLLSEGKIEEARAIYLEVMSIRREVGMGIGMDLDNLGEVEAARGVYILAQDFYQRAFEASVEADDIRGAGVNASHMGRNLRNLRWLDDAAEAYTASLDLKTNAFGPSSPERLDALAGLFSVLVEQGKWSEALIHIEDATSSIIGRGTIREFSAIYKRRDELTQSVSFFLDHISALFRTSRDQVEKSFSLIQWAQETESSAVFRELSDRLQASKGDLGGLFRAQQDLLRGRERLTAALNDAIASADEERSAALEIELNEVDTEILEMHRKIKAKDPALSIFLSEPISVKRIKKLLRDDEAMVVFGTSPKNSDLSDVFVWVVKKRGRLIWKRLKLSSRDLDDQVSALRCGLDREYYEKNGLDCRAFGVKLDSDPEAPPRFPVGKAHRLYRELFGEIAGDIDAKKLIVVPWGSLSTIPLQVLVVSPDDINDENPDYKSIRWLGIQKAVTVVPSVQSFAALRDRIRPSRATKVYTAFADPNLTPCAQLEEQTCESNVANRVRRSSLKKLSAADPTVSLPDAYYIRAEVRALCQLPDTRLEVECIAKNISPADSKIYLGEDVNFATLRTLSESGELAQFKILHFATHGLLANELDLPLPRAKEAALVLTPPDNEASSTDDGLLTASDISQLNLDAEWVVLSACNTGRTESGDATELSALARSFLYAGGRTILASNWAIYSSSTSRLLTLIFAQNQAGGRAEAFRRALQTYLSTTTSDAAHPAHWGAFSLIGEGSISDY